MEYKENRIYALEGRVLCNYCKRFIGLNEAFKIDDLFYNIACLECDDRSVIKFNTPFNTESKKKMFEDIIRIQKQSLESNDIIFSERESNIIKK